MEVTKDLRVSGWTHGVLTSRAAGGTPPPPPKLCESCEQVPAAVGPYHFDGDHWFLCGGCAPKEALSWSSA